MTIISPSTMSHLLKKKCGSSGPISLIDKDIVIGGGNLPGLKPNDTLLLPYAIDTSCTYSTSTVLQAKYANTIELRDGYFVVTRQQTRDTTYTIQNNALEGEVEVIIEHTKYATLLGPNPFEDVNGVCRYSVKVGAGRKESLVVKEQGVITGREVIDLTTKRKTINKWPTSFSFGGTTPAPAPTPGFGTATTTTNSSSSGGFGFGTSPSPPQPAAKK